MASATYIYNKVAQVYLGADLAVGSQLKLTTSSSIDHSLFLAFTQVSAGESTICTIVNGRSFCLEVWQPHATVVHLGEPNKNGSQVWTTTPAGDGFKLSNNFAGTGEFLDVDSASKDIKFSLGNSPGQIWTNIAAPPVHTSMASSIISQVTSAIPIPTSTFKSTWTSIAPSTTSSATPSSPSHTSYNATEDKTPHPSPTAHPIHTSHSGTIAAVGVACALVPLIFAGLVFCFFMRRKKAKREITEITRPLTEKPRYDPFAMELEANEARITPSRSYSTMKSYEGGLRRPSEIYEMPGSRPKGFI